MSFASSNASGGENGRRFERLLGGFSVATDRHRFLVARDKGIISTAINLATTVVTSLFIVLLCIRLFLSLLNFLVFAGYRRGLDERRALHGGQYPKLCLRPPRGGWND